MIQGKGLKDREENTSSPFLPFSCRVYRSGASGEPGDQTPSTSAPQICENHAAAAKRGPGGAGDDCGRRASSEPDRARSLFPLQQFLEDDIIIHKKKRKVKKNKDPCAPGLDWSKIREGGEKESCLCIKQLRINKKKITESWCLVPGTQGDSPNLTTVTGGWGGAASVLR